jgi:hypothetical protein
MEILTKPTYFRTWKFRNRIALLKLVHKVETGLSILLLAAFTSLPVHAQERKQRLSAFRDSLDQAIDISDWLVNKKGVLVLPTIITEPAVGYGAVAAVIYFHSSYSAKKGPPSMTGVLGGGTQNGTWMTGVFHAGFWKNDNIRYMGAAVRMYANLGFYGPGNTTLLGDEPVNLNLDAWLLLQQLKFRVAKSNFFIGGRYLLLKTDNTFEIPIDIPDFTGYEFSSTLSEVSLKLELDSRNNIFTPTKGVFFGLTGTYSDTWMGGDDLYGRIGLVMIGYIPAGNRFFLGIRYESMYSVGEVPFYARPIIYLRGAPLMKYQNKNTTLMEAELSWNVYKRWYLSGFTGLGNAFESFADFNEGKSVTTLGTGFRYLVARKLGTAMGMDFAVSNDDFAFYIIFGTAWLR